MKPFHLVLSCAWFVLWAMSWGCGKQAAPVLSETEYKAACVPLNIAELTRDAARFKGRKVCCSGQILVMDFPKESARGKTPYGIILSVPDEGKTLESGVLPLYISFDGRTDSFIYDQVTIYGEVYGDFVYQSAAIREKKLPRIDVRYLVKSK